MLLALLIVALAIYILNEKKPRRYITRAETEALQKLMRENQAKEYEERVRNLKTIDVNGKTVFMMEDEVQYLLTLANDEFDKARAGWLKSLSLRHEKGELTDSEFSEEINKCLDQTATRTLSQT